MQITGIKNSVILSDDFIFIAYMKLIYIFMNRKSKFGNKVLSVTKLNGAAMKDLIDAAIDINNATYFTAKVGDITKNAVKVLNDINSINTETENSLQNITDLLPNLNNLTNEAYVHAHNLRDRVSHFNFTIKTFALPGKHY